jgi:hypothetical protein
MDGSIGVQSEAGSGSIFWFTVALRSGAANPAPGLSLLPASLSVLVVASNASVSTGLERYAVALGASARCARDLDKGECSKPAAERGDSVVVLVVDAAPGARGLEEEVEAVGLLQRRNPSLRVVLLVPVTLLSKAAEHASGALDSARTVLLPGPARLEALRLALEGAALAGQRPPESTGAAAGHSSACSDGSRCCTGSAAPGLERTPKSPLRSPAVSSLACSTPSCYGGPARRCMCRAEPDPSPILVRALALERAGPRAKAGELEPACDAEFGRQHVSHLDLAGCTARHPRAAGAVLWAEAGAADSSVQVQLPPGLQQQQPPLELPADPPSTRRSPFPGQGGQIHMQSGGQIHNQLLPTGGLAGSAHILVVDGQ